MYFFGVMLESGIVMAVCISFYYSHAAIEWINRHSIRKNKDLTVYTVCGKMQMIEASPL